MEAVIQLGEGTVNHRTTGGYLQIEMVEAYGGAYSLCVLLYWCRERRERRVDCQEGIVYVVSCDTSRAETLQRPLTLDKLVQAGSNNMTSWQKFTYIMNLYWKVILQVTDAKN